MLSNAACCCGVNCVVACNPCGVPLSNLTLSWTNTVHGPGSQELIHLGGLTWSSPCFHMPGVVGPISRATFSCSVGSTVLEVDATSSSCGSTNQTCASPFQLIQASFTCNPFHFHYTLNSSTCFILDLLGYTTFDVDTPTIGSPLCCQKFLIEGCNGLSFGMDGATITIFDTMGGTQLAIGTTFNGHASLMWVGGGSVYVTVDGPGIRFAQFASSETFTCGDSTTITLSPATGYECIAGCLQPISETLTVTFSIAGAQTLTFSGSTWTSSFTVSGHAYVVTMDQSHVVTITRDGVSCGTISFILSACPPSFSGIMTIPPGDCRTELGITGTLTE